MDIQQITGTARKVSSLLSNSRYGLDYYQREYNWKEAQVGSLIDDLTDRFRGEFDQEHERPDVESYRPYFLGPTAAQGLQRQLRRDGLQGQGRALLRPEPARQVAPSQDVPEPTRPF